MRCKISEIVVAVALFSRHARGGEIQGDKLKDATIDEQVKGDSAAEMDRELQYYYNYGTYHNVGSLGTEIPSDTPSDRPSALPSKYQNWVSRSLHLSVLQGGNHVESLKFYDIYHE